MMISLFEYFDKACEMTVFPQPNAPGMAVVPPCTQLYLQSAKAKMYTALHLREECIQDTLTGEEGVIRSVLLCYWTGRTDGPHLHHGVLGDFAIELRLQDNILSNTWM